MLGTGPRCRARVLSCVQDMDLSLRCYLKGWQGVYLPHVDNPNEVPSTLSSYKTQQFR